MADIIIKALGFVGIIILGYVLKDKGLFTKEHGRFLGKVIVNITLPCALLSSANTMNITWSLMLILVIVILSNVVPIVFGYISERKGRPWTGPLPC